jgi:hypothetical protein
VDLYPFFVWCEQSAIGTAIRESTWLFPFVESFHLLALAMMGGAVLIVDLRLLGVGLRQTPIRDLARSVSPWLVTGLVVMLASGTLLFLSEALKCYENTLFHLKMLFLACAILFTVTIRRRAIASPRTDERPLAARTVALVSIGLWTAVGTLGRGIGFW